MLNEQETPLSLSTPCQQPLLILEQALLEQQSLISDWFQKQWQTTPPPVYGSVDLRNAGFKLAPIDMNLFPAGFNNLNQDYLESTILAAKTAILQSGSFIKKILILPENHTRNLNYWSNSLTLKHILEQAGFEVRFGWLDSSLTQPLNIEINSNEHVYLEPLLRIDDTLQLADYIPDFILLNNDLSNGIPPILKQLKQTIYPPAELGWSQRLKSGHFQYYAQVAQEFADFINIDPWFISPLFRYCGRVNFMQKQGMECLEHYANILFEELEQKYSQYHIPHRPFLVIKADAGTYGMAVMTIRDPKDIKDLNRKQRTRMSAIKGGQEVNRVIIQEGVYTFETIGANAAVAEPVVYLFGKCVAGGFYRVHQNRGIDENLNSPGMHFEPLPFAKSCTEPSGLMNVDTAQNRFYAYGLIAQLSMLAAAREMRELKGK